MADFKFPKDFNFTPIDISSLNKSSEVENVLYRTVVNGTGGYDRQQEALNELIRRGNVSLLEKIANNDKAGYDSQQKAWNAIKRMK